MYNKHQAMCDEADSIEQKYNQLDTNFQNLKESLEKEIIRRKYVENLAKVIPKTYNPTTLEDFMKGLENDHSAYLTRIKTTYKDVGLVCQVCDKRRKINPNSPRYVPRPPFDMTVSGASQSERGADNPASAVVISPGTENNPPRSQVRFLNLSVLLKYSLYTVQTRIFTISLVILNSNHRHLTRVIYN